MHADSVLDLRSLAPTARPDAALRAFDALAAGGELRVAAPSDVAPVVNHLVRARPQLVDWAPLERGPSSWRLVVHRRGGHGARTVSEFLAWDHDRLDGLLAAAEAAARLREHDEAVARFEEFAVGQAHHFARERNMLFPAFEKAFGRKAAAVRIAESEHRVIDTTANGLLVLLREHDVDGFACRVPGLRAITTSHDAREERTVIVPLDGALDDAGRALLVNAMQAL